MAYSRCLRKKRQKYAVLYPQVSLPATTRKQVGCTNKTASNLELLDSAELWEVNGKADKKSQLTISFKTWHKMKEKYFQGTQNISCFPGVPSPAFCKESSFKTFKYKCQILAQKMLKNSSY